MAEARQTIVERVARFVIELVGAEEVEKKIEVADKSFLEFAKDIQKTRAEMEALSLSFKNMGVSISASVLKVLPQATSFLEKYGEAMKPLAGTTEELSAAQWALTDAGKEAAVSTGLMAKAMAEGEKETKGLKDAFWNLNSAARALLRIFVGFKILVGMLGTFKEMAEASFNLQAELWRLRAVVEGVSDQIEGGAGAWEEWLVRLDRLRTMLPLINMTDLIEGLRKLTGVLGPLGLTADEIERVTGLIGQMAIVMGVDFPAYTSRFVTALGGGQRNVANFGIDLRDGNQALQEYGEELGFIWDDLNAAQRQWIRLGFFVQEAAERTKEITVATTEEWQELEKLRKERDDILAQSPELIAVQIEWAKILLTIAETLERLIGLLPKYRTEIRQIVEALGWMIPPVKELISAWDELQKEQRWREALKWADTLKEPWEEIGEKVEDFNETVKEQAEALEDAGDAAEEFGDRITRALQQAQSAVRSFQRAVEQAGIRLGRRFADIARNLEEKLADLESRFEARRDQLIRRFEERRAEIREDAAEKEEELRKDLNKRLRRMEEDHQNEMRELREDYLIDLEEAARKRDAVSMRRIQQRYILEKKQRERDYGINRRRAIEDYKDQRDELRKAREEQEKELEKSLERQLRELQENYERQQEEARLNAERQREDATRNYQEQLTDLETNLQNRLSDIQDALLEEEEAWDEHLDDLVALFDEFYEDHAKGWIGWLQTWYDWIERIKDILRTFGINVPAGFGTLSEPGISLARGGMGIARSATQVTVGEAGPEMFAAWPLGQRMPRLEANIRLTIDGTQAGAWSADFENQTLRVLREVLQEAL